MEFTFRFGISDIQESGINTKESEVFFYFIYKNEKNKLTTQIAYLLSLKVRQLLKADPLLDTYQLNPNSYSDEFINYFFSAITNSIVIDKNNLLYFQQIQKDLQIEVLKEPIKAASIKLMCQDLTSKEFSTDQDRFHFLCENIEKISPNTLKNIPDYLIDDLISNAKFQNYDSYANFLIENIKNIKKEYLENIDPKKISDKILYKMRKCIDLSSPSFFEQKIINESFERCNKIKAYKKKFNLLIVTANSSKSIDFSFINKLNNENSDYKINFKVISDTQIQSILNIQNDYIVFFDIVVVGGCDSYSYYASLNSTFFSSLKMFHNQNGFICMLHDVEYDKYTEQFKLFGNLIGYKDFICSQAFTEVHLKQSLNDNDIVSKPFPVGNKIEVAETHQTPKYDLKYVVLFAPDNDSNYYTENLDEHVADIQMGHTIEIKEQEQKLFYNILCHQYESSEKHQVKTKL